MSPPTVIRQGSDHIGRRFPLGRAGGQRQPGVDEQAMAVFHQGMTQEAEFGLLALAFAIQPGLRVGGRGMGRV